MRKDILAPFEAGNYDVELQLRHCEKYVNQVLVECSQYVEDIERYVWCATELPCGDESDIYLMNSDCCSGNCNGGLCAENSHSPGTCGGSASSGCIPGFVAVGGICTRPFSFQQGCDLTSTFYSEESCECESTNQSPILIDVLGDGFALTDVANGVEFNFFGNGMLHLAWTTASSDDAWLVLDRNGNGMIDSGRELFGNLTPQSVTQLGEEKNGFRALAEFDEAAGGGNGDGVISNQDSVFPRLRLWQDTNHNGLSEPSELHPLAELGLASLDLKYKESKRVDQFGNQFRYRAKVRDNHDEQVGRWAWDVFLVTSR